MELIQKNSLLWEYLSENQQGLILDGEHLLTDARLTKNLTSVSDYSYVVFPFAKAYEGFLKKLFLDLDVIKEDDYYGDDIRIGRILNPNYKGRNSVYNKLCNNKRAGKDLVFRLWEIWRKGRNYVFHYYPHNFRKLNYEEAAGIIEEMVSVMDDSITKCDIVANSIAS